MNKKWDSTRNAIKTLTRIPICHKDDQFFFSEFVCIHRNMRINISLKCNSSSINLHRTKCQSIVYLSKTNETVLLQTEWMLRIICQKQNKQKWSCQPNRKRESENREEKKIDWIEQSQYLTVFKKRFRGLNNQEWIELNISHMIEILHIISCIECSQVTKNCFLFFLVLNFRWWE